MGAVDDARAGLCRMIASGELHRGQALPSETELSDRLGVSRSSLREAQKMLKMAGVLDSRHGSTMFVSDMTPRQIMAGLEIVVPLLPLDRFIELFTLREVLEGHLAAQAAARMSAEDTVRLATLADELASTEPSDRAQDLDTAFHGLIIRAAGDEVMAALLETIRRRGRDYHIFDDDHGRNLKAISDEAHVAIASAIAARDPESARFLAMEHVRVTRRWLEGLHPDPTLT